MKHIYLKMLSTEFYWILLPIWLSSVIPTSVATQEFSGIQLILLMLPIFYEPLKFSIEITDIYDFTKKKIDVQGKQAMLSSF